MCVVRSVPCADAGGRHAVRRGVAISGAGTGGWTDRLPDVTVERMTHTPEMHAQPLFSRIRPRVARTTLMAVAMLPVALACTGGDTSASSRTAATTADSVTAGPVREIPGPTPTPPRSPDRYTVRFETSKGPFVVDVERALAPRGADRFYELVTIGFFDDGSTIVPASLCSSPNRSVAVNDAWGMPHSGRYANQQRKGTVVLPTGRIHNDRLFIIREGGVLIDARVCADRPSDAGDGCGGAAERGVWGGAEPRAYRAAGECVPGTVVSGVGLCQGGEGGGGRGVSERRAC